MGNTCVGGGSSCCRSTRSSGTAARRRSFDKPFSDHSPVYPNASERFGDTVCGGDDSGSGIGLVSMVSIGGGGTGGCHLSLAKMDSAPTSSVCGVNGGHPGAAGGLSVHHQFIANSEASLLKIRHHEGISAAARKSFVSRIPPLGRSGSNEAKHGSESKMNALFEKYRDIELAADPTAASVAAAASSGNNNLNLKGEVDSKTAATSATDLILAAGTEALCHDLELKPDDFRVLVLAWKCSAEQMCRFTRQQFVQGCRALKADSVRGIQTRLVEAVADVMASPEKFKSLYKFTFRFGLASSVLPGSNPQAVIRHLPIDMSLILWQVVFSQREPAILAKWLSFHETVQPVRGITEDTWDLFLPFALSVRSDLSGYDENEAWPSLFDDFVEHENDQANQNYETVAGKNVYQYNNKPLGVPPASSPSEDSGSPPPPGAPPGGDTGISRVRRSDSSNADRRSHQGCGGEHDA